MCTVVVVPDGTVVVEPDGTVVVEPDVKAKEEKKHTHVVYYKLVKVLSTCNHITSVAPCTVEHSRI